MEVLTTAAAMEIGEGALSEGEAIAFLTALLGAERVAAEEKFAQEVCGWLGYLPLGLELVGQYLVSKPRTSIATLLERLTDSRLGARALLRGQPMTSTHVSLAAAFEVSWLALVEQPRTQKLAAFVSLFGLAAIPQDILTSCFESWDKEDLEDAWERLMSFHLVGQDERLHPIVREFLTVKLNERSDCEELRGRYAGAIVASAEKYCKQKTMDQTEVQATKVYETHWLDFNQRQSEENFGIAIALVCINLGLLCRSMGRYAEAEPLYQRALEINEKQLGPDHPDTGNSLNNLALLYRSMGRYAEAEPLLQRALTISEQQLGPDHPSTGASLNNLAGLYESMGRYAEPEPLYQRALAISEKQLGPDHPSTGTSLNNLAELYRSMGRYTEAEPLYQRALAINEKQLGPDHPDTGNNLNNLALLYRSMGRYAEAEPLLQRALTISEQQLGPDHPSTGTSLNNLAGLYESMGRYAEAEPLYQCALRISEQQLGPDHPSTGTRLNNLALLYCNTDRLPEAAALMSRVVTIFEQALGNDHPNTKVIRENLQEIEERIGN